MQEMITLKKNHYLFYLLIMNSLFPLVDIIWVFHVFIPFAAT